MKIDNQKLDIIMAQKCLSSEKLSQVVNVSQVTIARIRNGSQKPRPITIGKIAKALGVKVEDLIEMEE